MIVGFLCFCIFVSLFTLLQGICLKASGGSKSYVRQFAESFKDKKSVKAFFINKRNRLKRMGADIFVKEGITVSTWYLYKSLFANIAALIAYFVTAKVLKIEAGGFISAGVGIISFFSLDLYLYLRNKSSNDEMMPDICEMSRSVLYGKRGGQYIIDAIKDAVVVVENKRLKMAMIRLRGALDAGRSLEDALYEFEGSFTTPEIASFCTVIKSLQTSGHVEEALKTLENNIERAQAGVNKRKCIVLENRTMVYVLFLAFDLLIMILYCIIMKLLDMQIAF